MSKLVIYYSLSENTKEAAQIIANGIGADLVRINTVKPMPETFASQIMYGGMLATFGIKPKVTGIPEDILSYDEIIIGTPIWAGKHSPAVNTLINKKGVAEKITGVFTLSGSGENDKCIENLKKILPNLDKVISLVDRNSENANTNIQKCNEFIECYR